MRPRHCAIGSSSSSVMRTSRSRRRARATSQGIKGPPCAKQSSVSCAMSQGLLGGRARSQVQFLDQEVDNRVNVIQVKHGTRPMWKACGFRHGSVTTDGEDRGIIARQQSSEERRVGREYKETLDMTRSDE